MYMVYNTQKTPSTVNISSPPAVSTHILKITSPQSNNSFYSSTSSGKLNPFQTTFFSVLTTRVILFSHIHWVLQST